MGKPNRRLNPRAKGPVDRGLLEVASVWMYNKFLLLPRPDGVFLREETRLGRGRPAWDWRILAVLLILCALLRKTWDDYEAELRKNLSLAQVFGKSVLPSKSTLYRAFRSWPLRFWRIVLAHLVREFVRKDMWLLVDATGISLRSCSSWFLARIGETIRKRDHHKLHLLQMAEWGLVLDFRITRGNRHDSPVFRKMLRPLRNIGLVFGDKAYCCKKTVEMILQREGAPFLCFKNNVKTNGLSPWATQVRLAKGFFSWAWMNIYHRRSLVESAFSALKRRYGRALRSNLRDTRRRELVLRLLAYNVRQILYIHYAQQHNIPIWVRAKK